MAETIYKVLDDCEVKKVGERQYEFTASTSIQDRDGEVIDVKGWDLKNFKKNPVIMYAHDYRTLPVGRASRVWLSNNEKLKNIVEFPPEGTYEFADIVERLVNTGYLKTESVGFIPKEWNDGDGEKSPKRTYTEQELLEISIVPVPSNPDALREAVDGGVITTKELEIITRPEETDEWIRIPVAECDVTATIDISKKEGIKALYCGEEKKVRTYMFDKRDPYNWTMAKAKKWVEEHKEPKQETYQCECIECGHKMESEKHCKDIKCPECGGKMRRVERPGPGQEGVEPEEGIKVENDAIQEIEEIPEKKIASQEELKDELDYVKSLIDEVGLNDEGIEVAWDLMREVMRLHGDDIPFDIAEKLGAVLNAKNKDRLNQIKAMAQAILDSAGKPEGPEEESMSSEELVEKILNSAMASLDKAQGKVS